MSRENVDFVRRLWQINVTRGAEACVEYATEDFVVEDFPELPDHATYEGPEGMQEIDLHFRRCGASSFKSRSSSSMPVTTS